MFIIAHDSPAHQEKDRACPFPKFLSATPYTLPWSWGIFSAARQTLTPPLRDQQALAAAAERGGGERSPKGGGVGYAVWVRCAWYCAHASMTAASSMTGQTHANS